jgi:beta-phosphoglucomutase-like phosphatase (HAD superfamily)
VKLNLLNIPKDIAIKINELKQDYTSKTIKSFGRVMEEKIELHSYLKDNDIKIACVTNSIRKTTIEMLKITGQYDFMDLIITNEDVSKNKPSPDCYNLAINKLDVNPNFVLCVEDSEKGILAAMSSIAKHLLVVKNTHEVNLKNIQNRLEKI